MFSPSNELIIFVSTDCSFVRVTSYYLNPNLFVNVWADVVLQSVITLIANFLSIKVLLDSFFRFIN